MVVPKPKRLLQGAFVMAAVIVFCSDRTSQTALALLAVLVEVTR